jgi:hypothetical protein
MTILFLLLLYAINVVAYVGYPNQFPSSFSMSSTIAVSGFPTGPFTFACNADRLVKIDQAGGPTFFFRSGCSAILVVLSSNHVLFAINNVVHKYNVFDDFSYPAGTQFTGHSDIINQMKSDGSILYTSSKDSTIRKWNLGSGTTISYFNTNFPIYAFDVNVIDGYIVGTGSNTDQMLVYSLAGTLQNTITLPATTTPTSVSVVGSIAYVALDQSVVKIDISTGNLLTTWNIGVNVVCMNVYRGVYLVVADANTNVKTYNPSSSSQTPLRNYQPSIFNFNQLDTCSFVGSNIFASLPPDASKVAIARINFFDIGINEVIRGHHPGAALYRIALGTDYVSTMLLGVLNQAYVPNVNLLSGVSIQLSNVQMNSTWVSGTLGSVIYSINAIAVDWTPMLTLDEGGAVSTFPYNFPVLTITNDTSNNPPTSGNVDVTFYFSTTYAPDVDGVQIKFENNIPCNYVGSTENSYTCTIPPAFHGGTQTINLISNIATSSTYSFRYASSLINSVTNFQNETNNFLVDEQETVNIYGVNFGDCNGNIFGNQYCMVQVYVKNGERESACDLKMKTDNYIKCQTTVPSLEGPNNAIVIRDFYFTSTPLNTLFTYGGHRFKAFSPSMIIGGPENGVVYLKNMRIDMSNPQIVANLIFYSANDVFSVNASLISYNVFMEQAQVIMAKFALPSNIPYGDYRLNVTIGSHTATSGQVVTRSFQPSGIPFSSTTSALAYRDFGAAITNLVKTNISIYGVGKGPAFQIDRSLTQVNIFNESVTHCLTIAATNYNRPKDYLFLGCQLNYTQFLTVNLNPITVGATVTQQISQSSRMDEYYSSSRYFASHDVTILQLETVGYSTMLFLGTANGTVARYPSAQSEYFSDNIDIHYNVGSSVTGIYVVGQYLFISTIAGKLCVFDYFNQWSPSPPINEIQFNRPINSITAGGDKQYFYVAYGNTIVKYSHDSLAQRTFNIVSTLYHPFNVMQLRANEQYIFVAGGNVIKMYDWQDTFVNEINIYDVTSILVEGDMLYAGNSLGMLYMFDSLQITISSIDRASKRAIPIAINLTPLSIVQNVISPSCAPSISGCTDVVRTAADVISCNVVTPTAALINININWSTCGRNSFSRYELVYPPPNITAITPSHGPTAGGSIISLTIDNLGDLVFDTVQVFLNGLNCTEIVQQGTSNTISCRTPPADRPGPALITAKVNKQTSINSLTFTYDPPFVNGTNRNNFNLAGGETLEIYGYNFGYCRPQTSCALVIVELGNSSTTFCGNPVVVNDFKITCNVPAGVGTGIQVKVTINGYSNSNDAPFFGYSPPRVDSISPIQSSQSPSANDQIQISGGSFAFVQNTDIKVYLVGNSDAAGLSYSCNNVILGQSLTTLTCTVPSDFVTVGGHFFVVVNVAGQNSSTSSNANYYNRAPQQPTAYSAYITTNETVPVLTQLRGSDTLNLDLSFSIEQYPTHGKLYQVADGGIGAEISGTSAPVTDSSGKIYYKPTDYYYGLDSFTFKAKNSAKLISKDAATVTISVRFANQNPYFETTALTQALSGNDVYTLTPRIMDVDEQGHFTIVSQSLPQRGIWKFNNTDLKVFLQNDSVVIHVEAVPSTNYQFSPTDFPLSVQSDRLGGFYPPISWTAYVYDSYGANSSVPLVITASISCTPGLFNNIWSFGKYSN